MLWIIFYYIYIEVSKESVATVKYESLGSPDFLDNCLGF